MLHSNVSLIRNPSMLSGVSTQPRWILNSIKTTESVFIYIYIYISYWSHQVWDYIALNKHDVHTLHKQIPSPGRIYVYGLHHFKEHWFRWWFVACRALHHYLSQYWLIFSWTFGNRFQWNLNKDVMLFQSGKCIWKCCWRWLFVTV